MSGGTRRSSPTLRPGRPRCPLVRRTLPPTRSEGRYRSTWRRFRVDPVRQQRRGCELEDVEHAIEPCHVRWRPLGDGAAGPRAPRCRADGVAGGEVGWVIPAHPLEDGPPGRHDQCFRPGRAASGCSLGSVIGRGLTPPVELRTAVRRRERRHSRPRSHLPLARRSRSIQRADTRPWGSSPRTCRTDCSATARCAA